MDDKTPAIRKWPALHPGFHMLFTPTGSSWINQVERWFGFLADQMIRRGAHKNVQNLEADIRAWVKDWNEDPKPFVWTKTAEESSTPWPASANGSPAQDTRGFGYGGSRWGEKGTRGKRACRHPERLPGLAEKRGEESTDPPVSSPRWPLPSGGFGQAAA
ncbi:hypothetical protein [Embleya sp. NBC_00896]|uniref:hypothetical protein n=1 Tax=Embleya sp. NBC_00896 TaxID=2975961 RepID=UPI003865990E